MSGHSKWANIRVKKTAQDARRGKIFTKYARLIEIAAREGGGDPVTNVRLRTFIDAAKAESVPNANIDRAVKKGTGELKGEQMQEVTYESYGPGGSAFIIECLTDNKNRTLGNVKVILSKNGGRFADGGSVAWMFERKGLVAGRVEAGSTLGDMVKDKTKLDELELKLIELGAEDVHLSEEHVEVVCGLTQWGAVRDFLRESGFIIDSAGLHFVPKQVTTVDEATMGKVHQLIDALEEDEDVSTVYTNARTVA